MKKKALVIAALTVLLLTAGYLLYSNSHTGITSVSRMQDSYVSSTADKKLKLKSIKQYGMVLVNPKTESYEYTFDLKGISEFNQNLAFINDSGEDTSFILLVYLNHEQISFKLEGSKQIYDTYKFDLKNKEKTLIPVRFDTSALPYRNNVVAFSVLEEPDKHASDINVPMRLYGANRRFSLIDSVGTYTDNRQKPETFKEINSSNGKFSGIFLYPGKNYTDIKKLTSSEIKARPGEKITLSLIVGRVEEIKEYTTWLTIDWKQVPLEAGKPYLYFKLPKSDYGYKEVTITAPESNGKYEVCAFLSPDPWKDTQDKKAYRAIRASYRFTLNVQ